MPKKSHPLAEVFGYPADNVSPEAIRHRNNKLCPFNNKVPNCTKDKANDPLGTCSITAGDRLAITCPIRFREDWFIADDSAQFFFPPKVKWSSLTEVRLKDKSGKSAGNIDLVLVSYDDRGKVLDFGAVVIHTLYMLGTAGKPFGCQVQSPEIRATKNSERRQFWPALDYLSSRRRSPAPPLFLEGSILRAWKNKKTAVALDASFFATLPKLAEVPREKAEIAWLVYDLKLRKSDNRYILEKQQTVYTKYRPSVDQVRRYDASNTKGLIGDSQGKFNELPCGGMRPDIRTTGQLF